MSMSSLEARTTEGNETKFKHVELKNEPQNNYVNYEEIPPYMASKNRTSMDQYKNFSSVSKS